MSEENLEYAGDIHIEQIALVSTTKYVVDLTDYLVEMSIFEDVFSNFLHGYIQLSDKRNIITSLNIIGEEYIVLKLSTPSLDKGLSKTFRVISISDRNTVLDNNTQIYTLHFCSFEAIADMLTPLYKPFKGKGTDIVSEIFLNFLETPRTYEEGERGVLKESQETTPLYILNEVQNSFKFISPGWSPSKCINWIASKSIPVDGSACDFLFWESLQAFYFGNIEQIYSQSLINNLIKGTYIYFPPNIRQPKEVLQKLFHVQDFKVEKTTDYVKNYTEGYLANRALSLDLISKKYDVIDYDYLANYDRYTHSDSTTVPFFAEDTLRNPATHVKFFPVNKSLFSDFKNNYTEKVPEIYGNRRSKLAELSNYVLNITVPGRMDMEAGSMIEFLYPTNTQDETATGMAYDPKYSGSYLVTAIRHKINLKSHIMSMEIIKDGEAIITEDF
jgi:hypothetical protein